MKKYLNPEMIVEIIENEDILTASNPVTIGENTTRYGFGSFTEEV